MSADVKRYLYLPGSLLLTVLCAYGLFYETCCRLVPALDATENWVATPCKMLHAGMEESCATRKAPRFRLELRYAYTYGGQSYEGSRHDLWRRRFSRQDAEARLRQMQQKGTWTCYVNPANPGEAVIDPQVMWGRYAIGAGVMLVYCLSSLYWACYHIRGLTKKGKRGARREKPGKAG